MLDVWVDIEAFGTPYNCNMVYLFLEGVAVLLKEIDPIGVENRKRRCLHRREYSSLGPNYAWQGDGYDKLKEFGLPIHGCIDGYSWKLLWLELTRSNTILQF